MLRDRGSKYAALVTASNIVLFVAGCLLRGAVSDALPQICIIPRIGLFCEIAAIVAAMAYIIYWVIYHKLLSQGPRYAATHALTLWRLRRALLDAGAGYAIEQYSGQEKVMVLPKIKVIFDSDLLYGTIKIRNHIKYNTGLDSINLSSALGPYVVEQQYLSDNENWYIYEVENSKADCQLVFQSYEEFSGYCKGQKDYTLFIDKRTSVPLSSLLLVGQTGSGKTYALYSLILQLLNWPNRPKLYFMDPKNSSLCIMGKRIAPECTAGTVEEIIEQLEAFHQEMQERKIELQEKLSEKLDADYRHWQMPAHIFVLDEFSSFQSVVNTLDKKARDNVSMLLRNIVLQGRQLGFFLWIIMQKSDSSDIPTAIRDNLIWKVVLGLATNTTYMTAFERAADLPKRNFGPGQGLYTYQGRTREPKITAFPTLEFDILEAVEQAVNGPPVM